MRWRSTAINIMDNSKIMDVDAFKNWDINKHQEDLFFPVVIQGQIVQFTDTCVVSKGSGNVHYFVKFIAKGDSQNMRYGWLSSSFEPDCDGSYTAYYVMEFDSFYGANQSIDVFEDDYEICLINRDGIIELLSSFAREYDI